MLTNKSASFLKTMMAPSSVRAFSAASIKSRFEDAYAERQAQRGSKGPSIPQPKNTKEYGQGYYSDKLNSMRQGYVHPYHSQQNPLVFTHYNYMRTLF